MARIFYLDFIVPPLGTVIQPVLHFKNYRLQAIFIYIDNSITACAYSGMSRTAGVQQPQTINLLTTGHMGVSKYDGMDLEFLPPVKYALQTALYSVLMPVNDKKFFSSYFYRLLSFYAGTVIAVAWDSMQVQIELAGNFHPIPVVVPGKENTFRF